MVACLFCQMDSSGECVFCRLKKKANDSYQDLLRSRQPIQPVSLRGSYPTGRGIRHEDAADRMYAPEMLSVRGYDSDLKPKSYSLDGSDSINYTEGESYAAAMSTGADGGEYESN